MVEARDRIAHLYRRAGFGAGPEELDRGVARGYEATVEALVAIPDGDAGADAVAPPSFASESAGAVRDPAQQRAQRQQRQEELRSLQQWWLSRMVASTNPLREKLTLLWHGHFATSIDKVKRPQLMYGQNQLFRALGSGSFESLTGAVAEDAAMLIWLDSNTNKVGHPNENFARELMELFTLGLGNYTEDDVKEAARCFTGWGLSPTATLALRPAQHDDGMKTVLGATGRFGGQDVVHLLTHSPASSRWIPARLWSHLAYPVEPGDPVISELAPAYAADLDLRRLLRAIFLHPQFSSDRALTGLVKQPVEYVVGALRALGLGVDARTPVVLQELGQVPFAPPSVGGWPQNSYWLSTAASLARLRLATALAGRADLHALAALPAEGRPDAVARTLSVARWSGPTAAALGRVAGDPPALLALALTAPEYVVN